MTEYEMASLFFQVAETAHAAISNYLTVVFAVLVVSYFAAQKIERASLIILLVVYSIFAIGMIKEIFSLYSDLISLGWAMAVKFGADGGALSWLGMASSNESGPRWAIPVAIAIACGSAYVGSLLFFFQIRKRGDPENG